ncbi:hypothetical protein AVEN_250921-1 [Araneus ventricosus]|uniref:Integrase catalytic domain-containing protein n=1 Tax=Araneus ventricosus TaxID=182803 RepID=A0A4Y2VZI8_ARAVE|nr:hypothetical protein AVEN_250921-1 [Araneus ventricosus]
MVASWFISNNEKNSRKITLGEVNFDKLKLYCFLKKSIQRRGYAKHDKAPSREFQLQFLFKNVLLMLLGPLVYFNNGNKWIIVISDYFTRYAEAYQFAAYFRAQQ